MNEQEVHDWMIDRSNKINWTSRLRDLASGKLDGEIPAIEYSLAADEIARLQLALEQSEKLVDDLVYFINRLVKKLRIDNPDSQLPENALDYLKRHGLNAINLSRKSDAD